MMPGRKQDVEKATDPRPVGRRPEMVAGLREELMRHLHAWQMAEQHAVRVQGPFWLAGRARRVDDDGRVLGQGVDRREPVGGRFHGSAKINGLPCLAAGAVDED